MERILGKQPSYKWQSLESLRAILAQPAEAEGAEVVAYVGCQSRMTPEGWENGDEYLVFADQASDADKRYDVPLMTVVQHLAALSAVTAERDKIKADRKACWEEFKALVKSSCEKESYLQGEIDQLRAEVEALRNLCWQANVCLDRWAAGHAFDADKLAPWTRENLRNAMAAKEVV